MRALALVLCLCAAVANGAPRSKKRKPKQPPPEVVATTPTAKPWDLSYVVAIGAGGFFGGGANRGPSAGATLSMTPAFADRRFALEVDLNWRMAQFRSPVDGYGTLTSTLHTFPLLPAARVRVFQAGKLTLDVRGGAGPVFVLHHLSSDFGSGSQRTSVGWELFAAAQAHLPVSPAFDLFAELRGGLGEASMPFVLGHAPGVQAMFGGRYKL